MTVDQQNMYLEQDGEDGTRTFGTIAEARAFMNELNAGKK